MGALSHLRIVEIGSAAATSYCARLFADFGATVQKIEPPAGDPLRRAAPPYCLTRRASCRKSRESSWNGLSREGPSSQ